MRRTRCRHEPERLPGFAGIRISAGGLLVTRVGGEVVVLFVEGVGGGLGRATGIRGEG
jgi:hypothetical protein